MRIMVLSHGHPDFGAGGAERAAYSLFQRLKDEPGVEKAVFVARAEQDAIGHSAFFGSFRGRRDEILACPPPVDGFTFQSLNYDLLKQLVDELIRYVRPDVVHAHHFIYWGLEIFDLFRKAGVRVVFTLHEYAAICANFGQMMKSDGRLCYASSPAECSLCIPSASAGKFFVRQTIAQHLLANVDTFIAPSRFLKERYRAWGLPEERVSVIENVMDREVLQDSSAMADAPPPPMAALKKRSRIGAMSGMPPERRTVLGYFGQINPFKGIDVLLQAVDMLPEEVQERLELRIHGENKHFRGGDFDRKVTGLLERTSEVVRPMGAYRNRDVVSLMRDCDWIVVPSIWWENSPIVIQEARMAGRPLLCSNIGGMAEKATPGVDRLFSAGSPGSLAQRLTEIVTGATPAEPLALAERSQGVARTDDGVFAAHLAVYRGAGAALGLDRRLAS